MIRSLPTTSKQAFKHSWRFSLLGVGQALSGVIYDVQMSKATPEVDDEIKELRHSPNGPLKTRISNTSNLPSLKYAMGKRTRLTPSVSPTTPTKTVC